MKIEKINGAKKSRPLSYRTFLNNNIIASNMNISASEAYFIFLNLQNIKYVIVPNENPIIPLSIPNGINPSL